MTIDEKLKSLRNELKARDLDAYLITGSDPHQSEYVASRWRTREYITGFSGSAGTVVITADKAVLWVDSRYFIQSEAETRGTEYIVMKPELGDDDYLTWLKKNLGKGEKLGVEATEMSINAFHKLSSELAPEVVAVPTEGVLDAVWTDRPAVPETKIVEMELRYAGLSSEDKLANIRKKLAEKGLDWTFIASVDDIAWTTNLRANDIPYNPVFMSYMLITMDKAVVFTSLKRFDKAPEGYPFEVLPYEDCLPYLEKNLKGNGFYNPAKVVVAFEKVLAGNMNQTGTDITTIMKARKNPIEMQGMRNAHLQDGVAYINFRAKIAKRTDLHEVAISDAFEDERKRRPGYLEPSFGPISGYQDNGAMCHYSATPESSKKIEGSGLLVLDTGGQYEFGMTDLTRTLLFGEATEEQRRDYTLVLKGHLALAAQRFPAGTTGCQLDVLARQYLWNAGMTFFHGTGHGVGCRLNVHEGPQNIGTRLVNVALEPGMVVSDEPGVYKEGRHGIRIENCIAVQEDVKTEFGQFYSFEVLSVVPYEKKLIDTRYLTDVEKNFLNTYHKWCYDELKDLVDKESLWYLEEATSPIE